MSIQIKLKNSVVQDSTPSASDLPEVGELAVNANINSIGGFMRASDNSIVKIFGPGSVTTPTATTTVSGIAELATSSETTTGTATNRVVTPAGLNAVTVAERTTSNTNYVAKAGSTMTGVLQLTAGSTSAPALNFGASNTGIYQASGANNLRLAVDGSDAISASTAGGINFSLKATALTSLTLGSQSATDKPLFFADAASVESSSLLLDNSSNEFRVRNNRFSGKIVFAPSSNVERARIDNGGKLIVGTSTARTNFFNAASTHTPRLQIESTNSNSGRAALGLIYGINNASGPYIVMAKHRSNSIGGQDVAQSNDETGLISFQASDGSQFVDAARISGFVDGTPGADDMPGRLVFSTTADGAAMPSTRLTIDKAGLSAFTGDVTIGTVSVSNAKLHIGDGSGDDFEGLRIINTHNDANAVDTSFIRLGITNVGGEKTTQIAAVQESNAGNAVALRFSTNSSGSNNGETEKMRLDSLGRLLLGTTVEGHVNSDDLTIASSGDTGITIRSGTSNAGQIFFSDATSGNAEFAGFIQYLHNQNSLNFGTDETTRMTINNSGSVGIGTTSPSELLQVAGTLECNNIKFLTANKFETSANVLEGKGVNGARLRSALSAADTPSFSNSDDIDTGMFLPGSDVVGFTTGGSERLRIDSSGRVLIGATTEGNESADELTINSSGNTGITLRSGTSANTSLFFSDATSGAAEYAGFIQYQHATDDLKLGTSSTTRLTIDSSGNLALGTASPHTISGYTGLTINHATHGGFIQFQEDGTNTSRLVGGPNAVELATQTSVPIIFKTGGDNERARITENGNLGIGYSSPTAKLDVGGTINVGNTGSNTSATNNLIQGYGYRIGAALYGSVSIRSTYTSNTNSGSLDFYTASGGQSTAERMRIDTAGRVLVGTTTQFGDGDDRLMIENANTGGRIAFGTAAGFAECIIAQMSAYWADNKKVAAISFFGGSDTTNKDDGTIRFATSSANNLAERMRITESGDVALGTTSPSARLHVFRSNDNQTACFIQNNGTTGGHGLKIRSGGTGTGTNLLNIESHVTATAKTRLLLDGSGRLRIGEDEISDRTYRTKISSETGQTYVLFLAEKATGGQGLGIATRIDGAGSSSTAIRFFDGPGAASVSTVNVTSTTITYGTGSSDRTMKKNFENWTDSVLNSFKNLNPQKFNYLVEDDADEKHKGFVAQDLVADFPEAYPKDTETDKYSFNPSGMVVYLMKAIQELEAKVAALEAA